MTFLLEIALSHGNNITKKSNRNIVIQHVKEHSKEAELNIFVPARKSLIVATVYYVLKLQKAQLFKKKDS